MQKKWISLVLFFLLFCISAYAENTEFIDLRDSQRAYGSFVASLNAGTSEEKKMDTGKRGSSVLVLVKTDGREINLQRVGADICVAGPGNRYTLVFSSMESAQQAVLRLKETIGVIYAETDCEIFACDTALPDEISFSSYGAENGGFQWLLSWARKGGNAVVAVVDSGVARHPFLASRLISGRDYVDNDDDPSNDEYGHGTHVAGIIADCTQGASVSLYSIRVLNAQGRGDASNAAFGILEAIEEGIPVINLSFVSNSSSAFLDDAVQNAVASGCAVVIAAGNDRTDTSNVWPAHLTTSGAIVVGAVNADGTRASYSNFGASVDVSFFGSGIRSCSGTGGYETRSGTSQATAHISAACALLRTVRGGLSPAALETSLKAVLGGPEGNIPLMDRLTPCLIPCHLESLTLGTGESVSLPVRAWPLTCGESIQWNSSNEQVVRLDGNGLLTAIAPGRAELTGTCANFDNLTAAVTVTEKISSVLRLPSGLNTLEDEALLNVPSDYVLIGSAVNSIGVNAVDPRTVILCSPGSYAAEYAEANGLQYDAAED